MPSTPMLTQTADEVLRAQLPPEDVRAAGKVPVDPDFISFESDRLNRNMQRGIPTKLMGSPIEEQ